MKHEIEELKRQKTLQQRAHQRRVREHREQLAKHRKLVAKARRNSENEGAQVSLGFLFIHLYLLFQNENN